MMQQKYVKNKQKYQEAKKKNIEVQKQFKNQEDSQAPIKTKDQEQEVIRQKVEQNMLQDFQNQILALENNIKSKEDKILELQKQYKLLLEEQKDTKGLQDQSFSTQIQNYLEVIQKLQNQQKIQQDQSQQIAQSKEQLSLKYQKLKEKVINYKTIISQKSKQIGELIEERKKLKREMQINLDEKSFIQDKEGLQMVKNSTGSLDIQTVIDKLEKKVSQQKEIIQSYEKENQKKSQQIQSLQKRVQQTNNDQQLSKNIKTSQIEERKSTLQKEIEKREQKLLKIQKENFSLKQQNLQIKNQQQLQSQTLAQINQENKKNYKQVQQINRKLKENHLKDQNIIQDKSLNQTEISQQTQNSPKLYIKNKTKNQRISQEKTEIQSPRDALNTIYSLKAVSQQNSPKQARFNKRRSIADSGMSSLQDLNKYFANTHVLSRSKLNMLDIYEKKFNKIQQSKNQIQIAFKELTKENYCLMPEQYNAFFQEVHKDIAEIQVKLEELNSL